VIALDTNVLLRTLVDDDKATAQCTAARKLVAAAGTVTISAAVFLETVWTLSRNFGFSRKDMVRVATLLLKHPKYRVQDTALFEGAVARFASTNIDFADAVALEHAARNDAVLHTFDRKLAKLHGARAVD
jgi:predicted nucleic-acid-binding protein